MHHQVFSIRFVQAPVWGSVKKPTSFTVRVTVIFTGTFRVRLSARIRVRLRVMVRLRVRVRLRARAMVRLRARIRVRARFRVMVRVRIHNSSQGCEKTGGVGVHKVISQHFITR